MDNSQKINVCMRLLKNRISIYFIVIFIFLIGSFVRLYNLEGHSLIADEVTWMVRSKETIYAIRALNLPYFETGWWTIKNDVQAISLPNVFTSGLSYYFTVAGQSKYSLKIFSEIEAVRFPVALLSSFFLPIFYLLIVKHVGKKVALLSTLFLALDPVSIGLGRIINQDSTLMITSFLGLLLYIYSPGKLSLFGSALFTAFAFLTKPQGLLIPVILFIGQIFSQQINRLRTKRDFIKWCIMFCFIIYLFFPYLWSDPVNRLANYLVTQFQVSSAQGRAVQFMGEASTNPAWYYYLVIAPYHLLEPIIVGLFMAIFVLVLRIKRRKLNLSVLAFVSLLYVFLYLFVVSYSSIKQGTRYLFPIWPYIILGGSYGLIFIEEKMIKKLRFIFWIIMLTMPLLAIIKSTPNYYLFHNIFTSPEEFQNRETIGFCEGVKPTIEYLGPYLFHGVKLKFDYCWPVAQYYTGFTLLRVYDVSDKPDFAIVEKPVAQLSPGIEKGLIEADYQVKKEIIVNNLPLVKIYAPNK